MFSIRSTALDSEYGDLPPPEEVKAAAAAWLTEQQEIRHINNLELQARLAQKGYKISTAYISNMRKKGMTAKKADQIAKLMGWPSFSAGYGLKRRPGTRLFSGWQPAAHIEAEGSVAVVVHNRRYGPLSGALLNPQYFANLYGVEAQHLKLMQVHTAEMAPTISLGDILVLDGSHTNITEMAVYVVKVDHHLLVCRSQFTDDGVKLAFDNLRFEPIQTSSPEVLGKAVAMFPAVRRIE